LSKRDWKSSKVIPYLRRRLLSILRFLCVSRQFCEYSLVYSLLRTRLFISRDQPLICSRFFSYAQSLQYFGIEPVQFTSTDFWHIWHDTLSGLGFIFRYAVLAFARQLSQYTNDVTFGLRQLGQRPSDLYRSYLCFFVSFGI
jgi:hypothetical protein